MKNYYFSLSRMLTCVNIRLVQVGTMYTKCVYDKIYVTYVKMFNLDFSIKVIWKSIKRH